MKIVRTYVITTLESDNKVKTEIIETNLIKRDFVKTIKKSIIFLEEI